MVRQSAPRRARCAAMRAAISSSPRFRRRHISPRRRQRRDQALRIAALARAGAAENESSFGHARTLRCDRVAQVARQIDSPAYRNLSLAHRRSLVRGRKGNAVRNAAFQIRSCPRNCEREVSSECATGGSVPPGRWGEAPIREPGDLPSVRVDATNIGRGVPVDDPKGVKSFGPRSRRRQTAGHARTFRAYFPENRGR